MCTMLLLPGLRILVHALKQAQIDEVAEREMARASWGSS
jgi:hypothetical protein